MTKYFNTQSTQTLVNKLKFGNSALKTNAKTLVGAINELKVMIDNLPQPEPDVNYVAGYPITLLSTNEHYDDSSGTIIHNTAGSIGAIKIDNSRCLKWTDDKVYYSDDTGDTWNECTPSNMNNVKGIVKLPNGTITTQSGFNSYSSNTNSWISTDNGSNWSKSNDNIGWLYKTDNYVVRFRKSTDGSYNVFIEVSTDGGNTWINHFTVRVDTVNNLNPTIYKHSDGSITIRYTKRENSSEGFVYSTYISSDGNEVFQWRYYYESGKSSIAGDIIKYNNSFYLLYNNKIYKSTSIPTDKLLDISNATIVTIQGSSSNSIRDSSITYSFDIVNQNLVVYSIANSETDKYISTDNGNTFIDDGIQMPAMPSSVSQYNIKNKIYFNNKWIVIVQEDNSIYSYVYNNNTWNRYNILKPSDKIFIKAGSTGDPSIIRTIQYWSDNYSTKLTLNTEIYKIGNKLVAMNTGTSRCIFGYRYSEDGVTWHYTGDINSVFNNIYIGHYIEAYRLKLTYDGYDEPYVGYSSQYDLAIIKLN